MSNLSSWQRYSAFAPKRKTKRALDQGSSALLARAYPLLLEHAQKLGFKVTIKTLTDRVHPDGSVFAPGALFRAPIGIELGKESFCLLAHELAHGLDFSQTWSTDPGEREAVAIGVEYMMTADIVGPIKASFDYGYAVKQGVTKAKILNNQQKISEIYNQLSAFRPVEL